MKHLWLFILVGFLAVSCGPAGDRVLQGYAEGDYVRLGARDGGILESVIVSEGDQVRAGDLLFTLEAGDAAARVAQSEAGIRAAQARLNDLLAGGRAEERRQAQERVAQATAGRDLARATFNRTRALVGDSNASRQRLDIDGAGLRQAEAILAEAVAAQELVNSAGRTDLIVAAEADVDWGVAVLAEWQDALDHRRVTAPASGTIERIYQYAGERVAPGAPVVSLLPPENIRIRFFIPEPRLGTVQMGDEVDVACDGCPEGLTARVSFIASTAEFTPPVIFSLEERAKLVFMAEVTPVEPLAFRPGQPVDVSLRP